MTQATLFRKLVQEHDWTTVETFSIHFGRAARNLAERTGEEQLAAVTVSRRSFDRWMRGDLSGTPQRNTRRILEHLFDEPAVRLFRPVGAVTSTGSVPASESCDASAAVAASGLTVLPPARIDPALVPHWNGLLHILAATHNAFGPHRMHGTVTREMEVIRDHRLRADGLIRAGLLGVEARWAEFASWTAENLGSGDEAAFWLGHSLSLAREGNDASIEAYALMRQAQRAAERRNAQEARELASAAGATAGASDRDRALSAVRLAQGHALAGDGRSCLRALQMAYKLVERADESGADDDPATIGHHCVRAYVQAHEGYCQLFLGQPANAVDLLVEALGSWPTNLRQDEQLARAWLALAYAADGHLAEAADQGSAALALTAASGSVRVIRALRALDRRLATGTGPPAEVIQFRSALALTAAKM
ncbi:hypothetical protein ACQPYK_49970 (plasmid) [Streptosporangium sp. CA-135522]|uniref:hypothetical protein n=1 Tax=Streptosporangium sp. CA-135522 TaxID=3240072 RepID=UPI003D8E4B17